MWFLGVCPFYKFFFFNDTATTEIYTLSLHDALPIWALGAAAGAHLHELAWGRDPRRVVPDEPEKSTGHEETLDRKSTRLNSSHANISYAVFCLKKKKS